MKESESDFTYIIIEHQERSKQLELLEPQVGEWTVFIDNLNRRVSRSTLWELFSYHGRVIKVFILRVNKKPRYKFTTFALVRFTSRDDMEKAVEGVNNSLIDGRRVPVSKAKFPKPLTREVLEGRKEKHYEKRGVEAYITNCSTKAGLLLDSVKDSRSYKDVLLGKLESLGARDKGLEKIQDKNVKPNQKALLDIHIPSSDVEWMDCSTVGVLKHLYDREFVQKDLQSDGLSVKLAKWGNTDKSCIITFDSVELRDSMWNENKGLLEFWFDCLALIEGNIRVHEAFYRVSITGVPLHCWHESFFKSLGNRWGNFIDIERRNLERSNLSVVYMIVRAACHTPPRGKSVTSSKVRKRKQNLWKI
ncbi:hypothetical protein V6N13_051286 [Hibiscus sabdariffa]